MKKYVKAAEEIVSQEDIRKAASDIIFGALEDCRERWGEFDVSEAFDLADKLGVLRSNKSFNDALETDDYQNILYSIDDEIKKIIYRLESSLIK